MTEPYLLRDGAAYVAHYSPAAYRMTDDEREAHRFATRQAALKAARLIVRARERDGRPKQPALELVRADKYPLPEDITCK